MDNRNLTTNLVAGAPLNRLPAIMIFLVIPLLLILTVWLFTPLNLEVESLLAGKIKLGTDFIMFVDGAVYRGMVDSSIPLHLLRHRPWGVRVLGPYIISLLPLNPTGGFFLLQWVCNYLNLVLVTLILARLHLKIPALIFTQVMFAGFFWNIKWSFFMPTYLESFTLTFILSLFLFALRGSLKLVIPIFILSTLAKESSILLGPVIAVLSRDKASSGLFDRRSLLLLALLVILWVLIMGCLDLALPEISSKYSPEYLIRQVIVTYITDPYRTVGLLISFFSGLGIIPLILLLNWQSCLVELKKSTVWLIFIGAGILPLLCGWDTARYFQMLLLPCLFLSAVVFQQYWERARQNPKHRLSLLIWTVCIVGSHYYLGEIFYPLKETEDFFTRLMPMVAKPRDVFYDKLGIAVLFSALATGYLFISQRLHRSPPSGLDNNRISGTVK